MIAVASAKASSWKTGVDDQFKTIKKMLNEKIMSPNITQSIPNTNLPDQSTPPQLTADQVGYISNVKENPHIDWLNDAAKQTAVHVSGDNQTFPDLTKYIEGGLDKIIEDLDSGVDQLKNDLMAAKDAIKKLTEQPNPSLLQVLEILGVGMIDSGLDITQVFITSILDLIPLLLELLSDVLNFEMKVPIVSDLYQKVCHEPLVSVHENLKYP